MHLILSSGWYGHSRIMVFKYDFDTCSFIKTFSEDLEKKYFAEGITRIGDKIYQLTWREKRIIVWKIKGKYNNKLEHEISKTFPRFNRLLSGWGAANQKLPDGKNLLWASDGSDVLKGIDVAEWKHSQELKLKHSNGT